MKRIILKPGEERRILAGHPWVYDNEAARVLAGPGVPEESGGPPGPETLESGECADVEAPGPGGGRRYLGRAIVNPRSRIIARIYSASKEGLDRGFFKRRLREAIDRRAAAGYDLSRDCARLVFAEADGLPGLIIDRYTGFGEPGPGEPAPAEQRPVSWLVIQFLASGMDRRRETILQALEEISHRVFPAGPPLAGIIEKSAPVRELEGLPPGTGLIRGVFPPGGLRIQENGLFFLVDPLGGQKTGHFLDQRDNRRRAGEYAARRAAEHFRAGTAPPLRILDCFCYTGGFGIGAALAAADALASRGASRAAVSLTALDASAPALELARRNAALNGLGKPDAPALETLEADAFTFLSRAERRRERYDLIILDPPAFAKNRSALEKAVQGYREINLRSMRLLARGGILVSCSCSQAMEEARFKRMIAAAAAAAERTLVQLDFRSQPPDHPIRVGYDESFYLKCGFYRAD
ncbi:MAG: class I SAM-dependent rRNA methyltransferase [Treponema sp.]|nr:class I SAM-dependent rRNA methyltransferase [Treponema sp.]